MNKVFIAARKHNTKRNKTGFILYACDSPPLNRRVKKNVFLRLCFIKNIKQNMRENMYSIGFTKPALQFCAPDKQTPISNFC